MSRRSIGTAARPPLALVLGLVLGLLAACGSKTSTTGSDDPSSPAPFDVSTATLTDQRFCDRLDRAEVGAVIGMEPAKVRMTTDRTIGDTFEGPVEEKGLEISDVNMCVLGSSTSQFIVTVQPKSSASRVQKTITELRSMSEGYGQVCEVKDDTRFGTPGAVAACHGTAGSTRLVAVATGLVGDSKFYCSAILNFSKKGTDLTGPLVDSCHGILEELATT